MNKEFIKAIEQLEKEKEVSKDLLIEAIESALVSAYKKNYGNSQNVRVNIDSDTGEIDVYMRKTVVDELTNDFLEISLEDAKEIDRKYQVGDVIERRITPKDFGRIAAQTAKQVVVQRIREAERGIIFDDYSNRQSEITTGIIQRISNGTVFINLGKTEGLLAHTEQVPSEKYLLNNRIKVYIMDVKKTTKGPLVYLSRSHPGLVKRLFELEVPEIHDGVVEIKNISREPGSRTKIAVYAKDENIDAVGACVGPKGSRVQVIVDEIFGEKIDIINWSDNPEVLISSALSPSKVEKVIVNENEKTAVVVVPDFQLSLAIGKEGQNVRLAAKLTGWKIDIKNHTQYYESLEKDEKPLDDDLEELDFAGQDEDPVEIQEQPAAEENETEGTDDQDIPVEIEEKPKKTQKKKVEKESQDGLDLLEDETSRPKKKARKTKKEQEEE